MFHSVWSSGRKQAQELSSFTYIFGFILIVFLPFLAFFGLRKLAFFSYEQALFLCVLLAAIVMWIFRLFADFIPGIFLLLTVLVFGLAPVNIVLSGLSSATFIMVMSLSAVAIVVIDSGLLNRLLLISMARFPKKSVIYHSFVFFVGILLTSIVPSIATRCQLMVPFLLKIFHLLNIEANQKTKTYFVLSGFTSVTLFASVFLSSSLMNFIVLGFLPVQEQVQFQWIGWLHASAVYGGILFVLSFILTWVFAFLSSGIHISTDYLKTEKEKLGSINNKEWTTIICMLFFSIGVLTFYFHKINLAWLSFFLLFVLLGLGLISKKDFQSRIDWPFLLFLASAIGIVSCANYLSLDVWLSGVLLNYVHHIIEGEKQFYALIILLTLAVRLVLPVPAAVTLICAILLPITTAFGLNPWLVSFIVLICADVAFMPYQNLFYVDFAEALRNEEGKLIYNQTTFLLFNALLNLCKFIALWGSIPYWKQIGLL